jgi:hypothetical protein
VGTERPLRVRGPRSSSARVTDRERREEGARPPELARSSSGSRFSPARPSSREEQIRAGEGPPRPRAIRHCWRRSQGRAHPLLATRPPQARRPRQPQRPSSTSSSRPAPQPPPRARRAARSPLACRRGAAKPPEHRASADGPGWIDHGGGFRLTTRSKGAGARENGDGGTKGGRRGRKKKKKKTDTWFHFWYRVRYRGWMSAGESYIEERISITRIKYSF